MPLIQCPDCKQAISDAAPACPHCGRPRSAGRSSQGLAPQKQSSGVARGCGLTFLVVVIFTFLVGVCSDEGRKLNTGSSPLGADSRTRSVKDQIRDSLKLEYTWSKEGFGNVMEATFTVRNRSHNGIKDLEIRCIHSAPSGTVIDRNTRTIYDVVPAQKSRTFENVNMGFINSQAHRSGCEITDFVPLN